MDSEKMKRNLMSELTEGIDDLAERRNMEMDIDNLLKDINRYDNGYYSMIQYPNGDYVKYTDVVDLFKKSYEEEI